MLAALNFVTKYFQANSFFFKVGGSVYIWSSESKCLVRDRKVSGWSYYWRSYVFTLIALIYMYQVTKIWLYSENSEQKEASVDDFTQTVMVGSLYSYFAYHHYNQGHTFPSIFQFLNQLVWMEQQYIKEFPVGLISKELQEKAKTLDFVSRYLEVVIKTLPVFVGIGSFVNPSSPLNVFSIFVSNLENDILGWTLILLFAGINALAWLMLVRSGCILLIEILTTFVTFQHTLRVYEMSLLPSTLGHSVLLPVRVPTKVLLIYRKIQLLLNEFNRLYWGKLFFLHTIGSVSLISSLYTLIEYLKGTIQIPAVMLALYPLLVIDGIVVLHVVYGFAGDLNQRSLKVYENLISCHFLMRSKLFKRFHKSCPSLRVMFGVTNYIEKRTSLIFIHFCFCRLLDLLIIK